MAFGFGGQLVTISKPVPGAQGFPLRMHEIHTEPYIADRARVLSQALDENALADFCAMQCQNPNTRASDMAGWKTLHLWHLASVVSL